MRRKRPAIVAPENVRAVLRNGDVVPCECRYEGLKRGLHYWAAVTPVPRADISAVTMDVLPPHTKVIVKFA